MTILITFPLIAVYQVACTCNDDHYVYDKKYT